MSKELEPQYGPVSALRCIECNVGPMIPKTLKEFYQFTYNHMHHIESLRIELV